MIFDRAFSRVLDGLRRALDSLNYDRPARVFRVVNLNAAVVSPTDSAIARVARDEPAFPICLAEEFPALARFVHVDKYGVLAEMCGT